MNIFRVDGLARQYSRVLLSKRLLRAFAAATLIAAAMLLLTSGAAPLVILATMPAVDGSATLRLAGAVAILVAVAAAALGLTVLYLRTLSRLAGGSRRASILLLVIIAAWLLVVAWQDVTALLQPPSEFPLHSLAIGALVINATTAWALAVGPFALWRADTFSREVCGDPRTGTGVLAHAGRLLDLPDAGAFSRARHVRGWLLVGSALLLEGIAFHTLLKWAGRLTDAAERRLPGGAGPLGPVGVALLLFLGMIAVLALSYVLIRAMLRGARTLRLRARRVTIESADQALAADPRAPVLFLRSFAEEQVPLTGAVIPWPVRAFDPGTEYRTLEEMIVHGLTYLGPVVAIADPAATDVPVGAARWRVDDGSWQAFVATQISRARLVVVAVAGTTGLQWEIDALRRSPEALARTIFVCPPGLTRRGPLLDHVARVVGAAPGSIDRVIRAGPADHVLAIALLPDGPACFVSAELTETAFYVALRSAIVQQRPTEAALLAS